MKVLMALIVAGALLGVGALFIRQNSASGQSNVIQAQIAAPSPTQRIVDACQKAVLARLKAPATAVFSPAEEELLKDPVFLEEDQQWIYIGNVDSENGFSALLRNEFGCQISDDLQDVTITFDE